MQQREKYPYTLSVLFADVVTRPMLAMCRQSDSSRILEPYLCRAGLMAAWLVG